MNKIYIKYFKRLLDFTGSLLLLIILSPLMLVIIIILAVFESGNVFFVQERPGYKGKIFRLYKFKTMNNKCDLAGNLLPDMERLHVIGKFLRKSSIDELPQLINVLRGDMSFVGPRPLLKEYLPLYNTFQQQRHLVRPGITGWAQVNGRNTLSWEKKFELDVWYVKHISFRTDIKILFLTIRNILNSSGVNSGTNETMPFFKGNT
jgi:undecaprenyl phosphate N,N'-diacetylbacillosamine 1-phosphate transferase